MNTFMYIWGQLKLKLGLIHLRGWQDRPFYEEWINFVDTVYPEMKGAYKLGIWLQGQRHAS